MLKLLLPVLSGIVLFGMLIYVVSSGQPGSPRLAKRIPAPAATAPAAFIGPFPPGPTPDPAAATRPNPCLQFIAVAKPPATARWGDGQGIILAIAMGSEDMIHIWNVPEETKVLMEDLLDQCFVLNRLSEPRVDWLIR